MRSFVSVIAAPLLVLSYGANAQADAEAEKYVDDALPQMYHSCASVVEESNGDSAYVDKVIRSLVAVSLYNREVDISKHVTTEAEKTALQEKFAAALGEACKKDNNALLAGAVDSAVESVLSQK